MKIAVAITAEPFNHAREQNLALSMLEALQKQGAQAQLLKLPIDCRDDDTIVQSILALRLLRVRNVDRLLAISVPALSIRHDDKCAWLLPHTSFSALPEKLSLIYLPECTRVIDSLSPNDKPPSLAIAASAARLSIDLSSSLSTSEGIASGATDNSLSLNEWNLIAKFAAVAPKEGVSSR